MPQNPNPLLEFLAGSPGYEDFLSRGISKSPSGARKPSEWAGINYAGPAAQSIGFGATGTALGLGTLNQILAGQGRTDPAAFNRQLAGIGRDTNTASTALSGALAQSGLQRSGVGGALQGALQASGAERTAGLRAQESQLAEDRKRQDLGLLLDLIINPSLQGYGISQGVSIANANRQQQKDAATYGAIASIIGSLIGLGG